MLGAVALCLCLCACALETPPMSGVDLEFPAPTLEQLEDITAPRFAGVLAAVGTPLPDRATLLADVRARLGTLSHVRREPSSPGAIDDNPETLSANASRLSRGDLLAIRLLLNGLRSPATQAEILRMVREDHADTTSEHGGVITVPPISAGGGIRFMVIPPMLTGRDTEYITPDDALRRAATSIALFHIHAHEIENAAFAGPGVGDLRFARTQQMTCVVITSLSATSFDVDYYNPDGAVVDLGIYHVPG
jgi:hypothetical protein